MSIQLYHGHGICAFLIAYIVEFSRFITPFGVGSFSKLIYEISFFFYMKTPDDFEPVCDSFTDDESKERLIWVDEKSDMTYYPTFFREELRNPSSSVKHIVTDNRK